MKPSLVISKALTTTIRNESGRDGRDKPIPEFLRNVCFNLPGAVAASEIGVPRPTVYSYLSFLQGTYFIDLTPPFTRSIDKEVSATRKVYVSDNGIMNQFAQVSEGSLFENMIFHNLWRYGEVRYYQKRSGGEIDFVLPQLGVALEVKQTGTGTDLNKLRKLGTSLGLKDCHVITREFNPEPGFIPALEL